MTKILVVAVISSVACLEPVEQRTSPPVGRLVVAKGRGTDPFRDVERTFGPVIASGTEAGRPWSMRGSIDDRGAATWVQTGTGGGSGGIGALPFQDLGWKKLGHFGSLGSGEHGIGAAS